jgi:CRP-like cAMP-binding protein
MATWLPPTGEIPDAAVPLPRRRNLLLSSLDPDELRRVEQLLVGAEWSFEQMMHLPDAPLEWVYFPESGLFSSTVTMQDGGSVEVGATGYEGVIGLSVFFEQQRAATPAMCQVPGYARAMKADDFRKELVKRAGLYKAVAQFAMAMTHQTMQLVACNRLHAVESRLARWLLMTHDRVGSDRFTLTQQFIAFMLGVHRPAVTLAAGGLQHAGIIRYRRGVVSILDRAALEASACECYRVITEAFGAFRPRHDAR